MENKKLRPAIGKSNFDYDESETAQESTEVLVSETLPPTPSSDDAEATVSRSDQPGETLEQPSVVKQFFQEMEKDKSVEELEHENREFAILERNKLVKDQKRKNELLETSTDPNHSGSVLSKKELVEHYELGKLATPLLELEDLKDTLLMAPKSLILALAPTGEGKTTISCNMAANKLKTGGRVLYLANEETSKDVKVRIACHFIEGISFKKYKDWKLTSSELDKLHDSITLLEKRLTVIASSDGEQGEVFTTTPEGVIKCLDLANKSKNRPDLVIIDYYQNISQGYVSLEPHSVNNKFSALIDQMKNAMHCPIVLMSQVHKIQLTKEDQKRTEQEIFQGNFPTSSKRTLGGRTIFTKATDIIEISKKYASRPEDAHASVYVYKNRFGLNQNHLELIKFDVESMSYTGKYTCPVIQEIMENN